MHRLVPAFIQQRFIANEQSGTFPAAALSVDVSGFTRITDVLMEYSQEGSEALANIIKDIFEPLMISVFEQGGFVTNLAGDAFTALFPIDESKPDAHDWALSAAWRIQQIMTLQPTHETPYGVFPVSVKVGVATGDMSWGIITSEDDSQAAYFFKGSAIEECAAAQKIAQAGQVVLSGDMLAATTLNVTAHELDGNFHVVRVDDSLSASRAYHLDDVDPDAVLHFFPLEALQQSFAGEFRQVVSLFIRMSAVHDESQLKRTVQQVFRLQRQYGGLLNRVELAETGATIVLFWGAPLTHENDLVRALSFILDLQAKTSLDLSAGIASGIAHAGYSGSPLAGEYTCHGRGPTLAARLMQTAPQRAIWIDESVARRASDRFRIEMRGEKSFKGFAQPRRVYALLERKGMPELYYADEIIGREKERQRLLDFCQPIWDGQYGGVMLVEGESGIGKSRLVSDVVRHSDGDDHTTFICQSDEILRESLNPFRYWLRGYFDQSEQQSAEQNKRSFQHKLERLVSGTSDEHLTSELQRTSSFLGALIDLRWPDSLYEQLDGQGRYENTITGLVTLLQAESLRKPVVLVLEDGHWLDSDSMAFLKQFRQIVRLNPVYPIVILITARPDGEIHSRDTDFIDEVLELRRLSFADLEALAESQLGASLEASLLEQLVQQADGNPFFAEQILRYLQEQDLIIRDGHQWVAAQDQEDFVLPTDIHSLLSARLDQLEPEVRTVVQTAAVLGREFELQLLSGMLPDDPHLPEKVDRAEQRSIWMALSGMRYLFTHMLLRDTAYHMQLGAQRRKLHQLAAQTLEAIFEQNLTPHYGEVAYHAHLAGLTDKAREYFERAGENAQEGFHNLQAVEYFTRALELTPVEDLAGRYQLLRKRERVLDLLGDRPKQSEDLEALADLARDLDDQSKMIETSIRKAWWLMWNGDYPQSVDHAQQALDALDSHSDPDLRIQALYIISWTLMQQGAHLEARTRAEMTLEAARQVGNPKGIGNASNVLGLIYLADGDYYRARAYLAEFLQYSRKLNDRERETAALGNLGVISTLLGQYQAAEDYHDQALPIAREIGHRNYIASEHINMSWVALTQEDWDRAIELGEAGMVVVRENGMVEGEAEVMIWLGHAWHGKGEPAKAMAAYERSLEIRRQIGQSHLAMGVLAGMARVALAQGDSKQAEQYVSEIVTYLDDHGTLEGTWEPLRIYLTCYQVLDAVNNPRAFEFLQTAYDQLHERAAMIPDEEVRRVFLQDVPWNRDIDEAYRKINSSR